jgi:hypothetical protein
MPDRRSTSGPVRSIEILTPDTPGLWKGEPEAEKQAAQAKARTRRHVRLLFLVVCTLLAAGLIHLFSRNEEPRQLAETEYGAGVHAPSFPVPSTGNLNSPVLPGSSPSLESSRAGRKDDTIRLAPTSKLSTTLYSSTLDSIQLLVEQGNLAEAEAKFRALPQEALSTPGTLQLAKLIDQAKRNAGEHRLIRRDSSHFQVKFEGGEDLEIWGRVLEILEEAYRDIGQQLGYYPSKPIVVVLITKETFHNASGGPAWSDGLFDPFAGRIKIPTQGALTNHAWLTRVLRHEYVHALLHDRVGGRVGAIPTWLNEGLAMQLAGDPPPDISEIVRGEIQLVPLSFLEGPWGGFSQKLATVAYLEGNSATVYLIDRFTMEKVRELLTVIAGGQPIAGAMQDRLFFPYDEFQRRWIDHLNEKLKAGKT